MALLRYQVRFNAWLSMITPEYAWGMFGDTVRRHRVYASAVRAPGRRRAGGTDGRARRRGRRNPPPLAYPSAPGAQAPTPPPAAHRGRRR